jgi:hypothetical protein
MSFSAAPVLLAVSSEPRRCPLRCGRAGRVVVQANRGGDPYFLSTPGSAARFAHEPTTRNPQGPIPRQARCGAKGMSGVLPRTVASHHSLGERSTPQALKKGGPARDPHQHYLVASISIVSSSRHSNRAYTSSCSPPPCQGSWRRGRGYPCPSICPRGLWACSILLP